MDSVRVINEFVELIGRREGLMQWVAQGGLLSLKVGLLEYLAVPPAPPAQPRDVHVKAVFYVTSFDGINLGRDWPDRRLWSEVPLDIKAAFVKRFDHDGIHGNGWDNYFDDPDGRAEFTVISVMPNTEQKYLPLVTVSGTYNQTLLSNAILLRTIAQNLHHYDGRGDNNFNIAHIELE